MRTQRLIIPVVAGIAVFGTVSAFAASIDLSSQTLGADDAVVAACDATTTIVASYTTTFVTGGYAVDGVALTSPAACVGKLVKVTLTDAAGAALASVEGPVTATSTSLPVPTALPAVPAFAAEVVGISAVIAG